MRLIPKPKPNDGNDYTRHFGAISGFRTVCDELFTLFYSALHVEKLRQN